MSNVTERSVEAVLPSKGRPGLVGLQEGLMEWTLVGSVGWVGRPIGDSRKRSIFLSLAHLRTRKEHSNAWELIRGVHAQAPSRQAESDSG